MIKPKEEVAETCDLEPIDRSTGDYLDLRLMSEGEEEGSPVRLRLNFWNLSLSLGR